MKKSVTVVAAALAGMMGFSGVAYAANGVYGPYPIIRSKAVTNMWKFDIGYYDGNDNPDADPFAKLVTEGWDEDYQAAQEQAGTFDIDAISDADNAAIFNAIGSDAEEAYVHEVFPLVFAEYDGGALNVKATFPTDYKYLLCDTVAVYINVVDADGEVSTFVVQGVVTDQGVVQFHINADCAKAIANGTAYVALFSAA